MSFLQPIWLYAISGIIIPIAIHFWSIKEGKALPVGSIALLEKSTRKYTRTLRVSQWWLLLLRCLLITALALLLAKPVQQQETDTGKGWILIDKPHANVLYDHFKSIIDSLLHAGYALHSFEDGFEEISIEDVTAPKSTNPNEASWWQLIKKADDTLPSAFPVYVFTLNNLRDFKGERPQVDIQVKWFAYAADTTAEQIVKAWRNNNNVRVMLLNSTASGNTFSYDDVPAKEGKTGDYTVTAPNSQLYIAYNNQQPVMVDTTALHISIYAGDNKTDAAYIKASLDAIEQFTKLPVQTTIVNNTASLPGEMDWLFWLSDEAHPRNITAHNIVRYAAGKEVNEASFINTNQAIAQTIALDQIIMPGSLHTFRQAIWKDGFGNPLLVKANTGSYTVYEFYSHFNPQWNGLPWSEAFPSVLLQLIFENEITHIKQTSIDERMIDSKQLQPVFVSNAKKKTAFATKDLSTVCWFIIFLLFAIERIVSFQTKTNKA